MKYSLSQLRRNWPIIAAGLCVFIPAYLFVYVWVRVRHGQHMGDFGHFYAAAQAMTRGENIYEVVAPGYDRAGYLYPPLVAFLYSPLAFLSFITAARMALILNVISLATGMWFGARAMVARFGGAIESGYTRRAVIAVALGALVLTLDKEKADLQMLQTNSMTFACLMLGLWFLDRQPKWAGAALGFAMNIKYQSLAMLPYFLIRRRWKAAGWMAIWTAFWAMLPGLLVGFSREVRYMAVAYGGILHLVGINTGSHSVADVEDMGSTFSISIPAALARIFGAVKSTASPMMIGAAIGLLWLAVVVAMYAAKRVRLLRWPTAIQQQTDPWKQIVAVEWMILIATTVCFSPQTNMRHMLMSGVINLLAMAILVTQWRKGIRWQIIAGILILAAGLDLPPGDRAVTGSAVVFWHYYSGPAWMMLVATALVAWGALSGTPNKLPAVELQDESAKELVTT